MESAGVLPPNSLECVAIGDAELECGVVPILFQCSAGISGLCIALTLTLSLEYEVIGVAASDLLSGNFEEKKYKAIGLCAC